MDILRKELNALYASQHLEEEKLDTAKIKEAIELVKAYVAVNNCCCVITDASADICYIIGGRFSHLLGITDSHSIYEKMASSDEDVIYTRLHPEDLVEKRMLEYEFFRDVDSLSGEDKKKVKATCTIRIKNRSGNYIAVANSTQVLFPSPAGKTWLILCCYDISSVPQYPDGISPRIVNNITGEIVTVSTMERRQNILTPREKEILRLIQQGRPSKQIADILDISIHTVNRHRQNIIGKLSVGSTIEAIMAATLMKLL